MSIDNDASMSWTTHDPDDANLLARIGDSRERDGRVFVSCPTDRSRSVVIGYFDTGILGVEPDIRIAGNDRTE